jgi:hypothetical protein
MHAMTTKDKWAVNRRACFVGAGVGLLALAAVLLMRPTRNDSDTPNEPSSRRLESISIGFDGREASLRSEIRIALDSTANTDALERLTALRNAPSPLTDEETTALLAELLKPRGANEPAGRHSELFHEIALVLREETKIRERLSRVLATVAGNERRDLVVRDYALQHLRQVWVRSDDSLKLSIQATFADLVRIKSDLSASALLSLHLLDFQHPTGAPEDRAVSDEDISTSIRAVLDGNATADTIGLEMAALRIIGDRGLDSFTGDLRRIAADSGGQHALVRMAAISAISGFHNPDNQAFLSGLDRSDPRIESAVSHALVRLNVSR